MTLDLATTLAVLSLLGVVLGAGRVFFVVETKQAEHAAKLAKLETMSDDFNGPSRARLERLAGRIEGLEKDVGKLATVERVDAILSEMRQGFAHLAQLIGAMERRHMSDKEDT